ncbi:hypothetical protein MXZ79_07260 [Streptococcus uberis]|nr:hypothetical protein [Streptococcus uberis]MCK1204398.1 hypothetical protein [Streptococcus uberis]
MGSIDSLDDELMKSQEDLEKLEDHYHLNSLAISEKFYELEDRRSEFERMLQETYEATSHQLRQDEFVDEEAFMGLTQIIESFRDDFDTEYAKENRRLRSLEEDTNQEYYKKRQAIERKMDQLMSERRDNGNRW